MSSCRSAFFLTFPRDTVPGIKPEYSREFLFRRVWSRKGSGFLGFLRIRRRSPGYFINNNLGVHFPFNCPLISRACSGLSATSRDSTAIRYLVLLLRQYLICSSALPSDPQPTTTRRTLPDGYMNTLEIYRNQYRLALGEDVKRLSPYDLREGYGLYKIPTKAELKRQLGKSMDKN